MAEGGALSAKVLSPAAEMPAGPCFFVAISVVVASPLAGLFVPSVVAVPRVAVGRKAVVG